MLLRVGCGCDVEVHFCAGQYKTSNAKCLNTMPRQKKKAANKRALVFAVRNKYRAFPVVRVVKVASGDTVELILDLGFTVFKQERVVLSGIVAPSIRTTSAEEKILGEKAKVELEHVAVHSDNLECVVDGKDKHGRTTGVLFSTADESINEHMMNGGFVWSADSPKDMEMLRLLQSPDGQ